MLANNHSYYLNNVIWSFDLDAPVTPLISVS